MLAENLYFAGRLIKSNSQWVVTDRLGSVVKSGTETLRYFPWGEERSTTTQNRDKFGAYFRDSTGLDYALNRYYSSSHGRFLTPDPSPSGGAVPEAPSTWNRYPYALSDPVNRMDPSGLNAWFCTAEFSYEDCMNSGFMGRRDGGGDPGGGGLGSICEDRRDLFGNLLPKPLMCYVAPIVVSLPPPTGPDDEDRSRIPTSLRVMNDCYWSDGTQYTVGYTRVITYQVLDEDGRPFYGSEVPTVTETVVTTSGPRIVGGGVWSRAANTINPRGVFTDYLSANGNAQPSTATQTFSADGNALRVNIGAGSPTVLNNTYSASTVTVNGTTSPRPCRKNEDPR